MPTIQKSPAPSSALIQKYTHIPHTYTDCYRTDLPYQISFPEYLLAFYTTPLFKLERLILLLVRKPSTDEEARALADGKRASFAAWTVEARTENQILMCDFMSRTRSWLMAIPVEGGTRLYFGSAVVPEKNPRSEKLPLGLFFHALLGFHKIYSVLLLASARSKLMREVPS
jgi:hypothetical protein